MWYLHGLRFLSNFVGLVLYPFMHTDAIFFCLSTNKEISERTGQTGRLAAPMYDVRCTIWEVRAPAAREFDGASAHRNFQNVECCELAWFVDTRCQLADFSSVMYLP